MRNNKYKQDDSENVKNNESSNDEENLVSLKQAKFDVFKFGIKGFDKAEQENAKMQLAIKLGAKVRLDFVVVVVDLKLFQIII